LKQLIGNLEKILKPETLNEILAKCATKIELSFLAISKCEPIIGFISLYKFEIYVNKPFFNNNVFNNIFIIFF